MFCFGGGGFRRGQSQLFATPGTANPLACSRRQGPQCQPVSGAQRRQASRSHAQRSHFSAGGTSVLVGVCSLACATHAHDGRWEGRLPLAAAAQNVYVGQVPVFSGWPHWEQGHTRFWRCAPSGGAPAGPTVPPQRRLVPPPGSGARASSPSFAGRSSRARRGPLLTRGRGFRVEERPQVSLSLGQPRAGHNIHRVRPGGPAALPTFRQRGRAV
ncbi:hypothetical protein NDU88_001675 [Pleurodeles waltl]|uniref:Uncharacterized protein n=1 Tax=Pleurodeles waltl TaxID=8319 RepID=A0AAV7M0C6_PLEWA|nr:hypothetical protein NDU88_001675 [Pleurodeles waltl]